MAPVLQHVFVVGGANSAGQAAMHLSRYAEQVTMLVRGSTLAATMSDYRIRQIDAATNSDVRCRSEAVAGFGDQRLTGLAVGDLGSG